jgi:hypothetical protein
MNEMTTNFIIGIASSVTGALIVYIASYSTNLTKKSRQASREKALKEKELWLTQDLGIRQGITNKYLFDILKYLLLGSIIGALGTMIAIIDSTGPSGFLVYRVLLTSIGILSFIVYFIGLGKVVKYMRLRKMDFEKHS